MPVLISPHNPNPNTMQTTTPLLNTTSAFLPTEEHLTNRKKTLSALWTFVSLNYLYCDLIGLMDASKLRQYLAGTIDGLVMSQEFLLGAAIFMEIPLVMIPLSKMAKGTINRRANMVAGAIMTVVQLATLFLGPPSTYYLFFSGVEIATTAFIVWYAWKKLLRAPMMEVQ